jgi:2-phospho-L-lactate/phosphoenolpyruvate guanylyltransferase
MTALGASGHWVVLLAVKPLALAKTRLDRPDRSAVTLAMAADTASAAASVGSVQAVLVVSDDEQARMLLSLLAVVVADTPAAGLNPALSHGAVEAARRWPTAKVAVLAADLPALQPPALAEALALASRHERAIVADAGETGTVLLTAQRAAALDPGFGTGSRDRHLRSGAVDLTPALTPGDASAGLRRDVDTAADLEIAVHLGVGPFTAKALGGTKSVSSGWQTSRQA